MFFLYENGVHCSVHGTTPPKFFMLPIGVGGSLIEIESQISLLITYSLTIFIDSIEIARLYVIS